MRQTKKAENKIWGFENANWVCHYLKFHLSIEVFKEGRYYKHRKFTILTFIYQFTLHCRCTSWWERRGCRPPKLELNSFQGQIIENLAEMRFQERIHVFLEQKCLPKDILDPCALSDPELPQTCFNHISWRSTENFGIKNVATVFWRMNIKRIHNHYTELLHMFSSFFTLRLKFNWCQDLIHAES